MRSRQWFLSTLLFSVSLAFLLFSQNFFSRSEITPAAATTSLPVTPVAQCNVTLLANKDYYPFLKEYFRKAEKSILGTVYLFKTSSYPDNEPVDLMRELIAARKRNVNVELVIDYTNDNNDYREANLHAAETLRKAGIKVDFDQPDVATHAKAFVIDGRYCFIGSHNITHAAMSMNKELSLFIDSTEMAHKIDDFIRQIPVTAAPPPDGGQAP